MPSDGPEKPATDKAASKPNDNLQAKPNGRKAQQGARKAAGGSADGRTGTATLTAAPPKADQREPVPTTPQPNSRLRTARKWGLRVVLTVAAIAVLWTLFLVFVHIATAYMWFDSVHHAAVYTTMIKAEVLLFCVFALIGGAVGGLTMLALLRMKKRLPFDQKEDPFRWTFRNRVEPRVRWLFMALAIVVPAVRVGSAAASHWQAYLLWAHSVPWHVSDPQFHKDISFFVEIYPFHVLVVSLLSQAVVYGLWIAAIAGYWYGGWRLRKAPQKITRGFTQLMSVLLISYFVLKAVYYWVSQYSAMTSQQGPVTGAGYTTVHAVIPGTYGMVAIGALAALVVLANLLRRVRVRWIVATIAVAALAWTLVGTAWPALLYHFREAPSAATLDLSEIGHNQQATMSAFGLQGNVTTVSEQPQTSVQGKSLVQLANKTSQLSLIDPNQLSPTFNVEQQLQAYYAFKGTLDTGHFDINGHSQDVAFAARELQSSGIPKPSWVNSHLVYTHGYGVVAAPVTKVDPKTESPVFLDGGMPPGQQIPIKRPQIYFGQAFSSGYAIVGKPKGDKHKLEFDHPGSNGSTGSAHTTYHAHGGIPIGSAMRRLLFAVQMHDPNIFFSSDVNNASQLLEIRSPRARVAKVAPWLTLDGDVYPAIVNGQIKWVVDGYTTTSNYPDAQTVNLHSATSTTLTSHGATVAQPNRQVNYMQNSVKAVVDAYTGKVTLYEWNQQAHPDPLLKTWESVFPGLVKPQSDIPSALLSQLRYPTDLFNVQRALLAKYHVGQPDNFYSGNDFWAVPSDPTVGAAKTINSTGAHVSSTPNLPSRYASMALDNSGNQHYSLSSPMVTLNGRQLAAFMYVNSEPGPDYGKITLLEFPPGTGGESPLQVQNDIESNTKITEALTLQRGGNSRVVLGGLEAVPVAGQMLYVEPIYTQSNGGASFPILRHVIALYGTGDPSFATSLSPALRDAITPAQ